MPYKKLMRSHTFKYLLIPILVTLFGCSMDSDSALLHEMRVTMTNTNGDWEAKNQKISELVENTFPIGTDLNTTLLDLSKQGFEINEYRPEGWRVWPKGNIQNYPAKHKPYKYIQGEIFYSAEKKYGLPLNRYGAVVSITTNGKNITEISGGIYPYHL